MALIRGTMYIILSIIWLGMCSAGNCQEEMDTYSAVNCQPETDMHSVVTREGGMNMFGSIQTGPFDTNQNYYVDVNLKAMKPSKDVFIKGCIDTLHSHNKFGVLKLPPEITVGIAELMDKQEHQFKNDFHKILQSLFDGGINQDSSKRIVIPLRMVRHTIQDLYVPVPHIDILHDATIEELLTQYGYFSMTFVELATQNAFVRSRALEYYDGNVEQCVIDMLTIEHTMNIWTPITPVNIWPLAFTPPDQCPPSRTMVHYVGNVQPIQILLQPETNDWYTRANMQPGEIYVWDSRRVAHAAVDIADGAEGGRSSVSSVLLILVPKADHRPPTRTGPKCKQLCYSKRFLHLTKFFFPDEDPTVLLRRMGYTRHCNDLSQRFSSSPSHITTSYDSEYDQFY